ncbi:uncharacterized protein V6R79_025669 [Siganus canaliculatus]
MGLFVRRKEETRGNQEAETTDSFTQQPTTSQVRAVCNESRLQLELEHCGDSFKQGMGQIDPRHWCNLTHFIEKYHDFTNCTEVKSDNMNCYWPNPLVESFIIRIHKQFFGNCSNQNVVWVDPPDETLTALILVPVFLTLAMIALVVWCSKRSDILA